MMEDQNWIAGSGIWAFLAAILLSAIHWKYQRWRHQI